MCKISEEQEDAWFRWVQLSKHDTVGRRSEKKPGMRLSANEAGGQAELTGQIAINVK